VVTVLNPLVLHIEGDRLWDKLVLFLDLIFDIDANLYWQTTWFNLDKPKYFFDFIRYDLDANKFVDRIGGISIQTVFAYHFISFNSLGTYNYLPFINHGCGNKPTMLLKYSAIPPFDVNGLETKIFEAVSPESVASEEGVNPIYHFFKTSFNIKLNTQVLLRNGKIFVKPTSDSAHIKQIVEDQFDKAGISSCNTLADKEYYFKKIRLSEEDCTKSGKMYNPEMWEETFKKHYVNEPLMNQFFTHKINTTKGLLSVESMGGSGMKLIDSNNFVSIMLENAVSEKYTTEVFNLKKRKHDEC